LKFLQTYSVVDRSLRILWVGGDWDEFALENQGPAAVANRVLSTRLDDHIVGEDSKAAWNAILETVFETQKEVKLDYRADSPHKLRRVQLSVRPMKDDRVLMVHDLRDVQSFVKPFGNWHYRHDANCSKCSFCNSVRHDGGQWIAPEALENHPTAVRYVVCETCLARIEEAISATRENRRPQRVLVNGFGPQS
jgi:hypothetical protein